MTERRDQPFPRARKRFGQHFLEPAWVARLVEAVHPDAGDTFLEIGPGRGALTRVLAARVERVVAVEIDRDLAAALPAIVPPNVTVVEGDFLAMDLEGLLREDRAGLLREDRAGLLREDRAGLLREDRAGLLREDRAGLLRED